MSRSCYLTATSAEILPSLSGRWHSDWRARVFVECEFSRRSAETLLSVAGVMSRGAQDGCGVVGYRFGVAAADDVGVEVGEPLE